MSKIHPTHFQVSEMPWREKEKQAILLFKEIIEILEDYDLNHIETTIECLDLLRKNLSNSQLVDWVMKYKGE